MERILARLSISAYRIRFGLTSTLGLGDPLQSPTCGYIMALFRVATSIALVKSITLPNGKNTKLLKQTTTSTTPEILRTLVTRAGVQAFAQFKQSYRLRLVTELARNHALLHKSYNWGSNLE